jgi:hypothetical protein
MFTMVPSTGSTMRIPVSYLTTEEEETDEEDEPRDSYAEINPLFYCHWIHMSYYNTPPVRKQPLVKHDILWVWNEKG